MHILKILPFVMIFERVYTRRGDSKRFGDFSWISPILSDKNKALTNILRLFLWNKWIFESSGTYTIRTVRHERVNAS